MSWALLGNLPAARKVRLANLTLGVLHVLDATGTVLAQDLEVGSVYVMNCGDVR